MKKIKFLDGKIKEMSLLEIEKMNVDEIAEVYDEVSNQWQKPMFDKDISVFTNPEENDFKAMGGQPYWGRYKADHKVRNGVRQFSAILWNIPFGQSWEEWAEKTPARVRGHYFPKPTRYKSNGVNLWGEFDVPDTTCNPTPSYGYFEGVFNPEWLDDGRKMRLTSNVTYIDPYGKRWTAPAGHEIDGASIPSLLWSIAGPPFAGKYRFASVFHDVECDTRANTFDDVHDMFYYAMLAKGVSPAEAWSKVEPTKAYQHAIAHHFGEKWIFFS
ncbi:DUF1353 domain-containing protein [Flavobacterium sp.]|uniref:DUF1353 domain-containing protein n=1 Tax=Flavobacterium sp. TaxID=239 RepID=UPI0040483ECD